MFSFVLTTCRCMILEMGHEGACSSPTGIWQEAALKKERKKLPGMSGTGVMTAKITYVSRVSGPTCQPSWMICGEGGFCFFKTWIFGCPCGFFNHPKQGLLVMWWLCESWVATLRKEQCIWKYSLAVHGIFIGQQNDRNHISNITDFCCITSEESTFILRRVWSVNPASSGLFSNIWVNKS